MKVRYEFVNGEISEIEVDDNLGELLVDFDRQEYNNDHKENPPPYFPRRYGIRRRGVPLP